MCKQSLEREFLVIDINGIIFYTHDVFDLEKK